MGFWFVVIVCAVVFALCFLVDGLAKKLRGKARADERAVRMPKRSVSIGMLLIVFALCAVLFWVPQEVLWLRVGCFVVAAMGVVLIVQYLSFSVRYDEGGFTVAQFARPKRTFRYADIRAQRSLMTRSGIHATLLTQDDSVSLTSAMEGADVFLRFAFGKWCAEKGIDPESIENNPQMMTYFPDAG